MKDGDCRAVGVNRENYGKSYDSGRFTGSYADFCKHWYGEYVRTYSAAGLPTVPYLAWWRGHR